MDDWVTVDDWVICMYREYLLVEIYFGYTSTRLTLITCVSLLGQRYCRKLYQCNFLCWLKFVHNLHVVCCCSGYNTCIYKCLIIFLSRLRRGKTLVTAGHVTLENPQIWGKIKLVLREGWQRSALKFIEIFPNNIVILVATWDYYKNSTMSRSFTDNKLQEMKSN
jgi:hypothetical protein